VGVPGLALTTAGNASVIAALEPVFILPGAWLVFATRPGAVGVACIGVAVLGVVLTSGAAPGGGAPLGDGLILLGTLCAAAYVLASSRLALTMPAVLLTALQQSVGLALVLGLTALALWAGWQALPATLDPAMLALAVLSGLIQYALAFWLYLVGLKGVPPVVAGLALTTTPVFGVLGGVVVLGEGLAAAQAPGLALVLAALVGMLAARQPA
jgi:drug/metabolite transporter (DMT)-like permease